MRTRTSAQTPEKEDGREALRLSTTGTRARTRGHSPSFPAVLHRPLCSCCSDERAITTASHSYFLSLFTFRAGGGGDGTQAGDFQELARTLTSPGQTIDVAAVRVPGSLSTALLSGLHRRPSPALRRPLFSDDDGSWRCGAVHPVEHQSRCAYTCDGDRVAPQPVRGYVKEVRGFQRSSVWEASLGVREGKA